MILISMHGLEFHRFIMCITQTMIPSCQRSQHQTDFGNLTKKEGGTTMRIGKPTCKEISNQIQNNGWSYNSRLLKHTCMLFDHQCKTPFSIWWNRNCPQFFCYRVNRENELITVMFFVDGMTIQMGTQTQIDGTIDYRIGQQECVEEQEKSNSQTSEHTNRIKRAGSD